MVQSTRVNPAGVSNQNLRNLEAMLGIRFSRLVLLPRGGLEAMGEGLKSLSLSPLVPTALLVPSPNGPGILSIVFFKSSAETALRLSGSTSGSSKKEVPCIFTWHSVASLSQPFFALGERYENCGFAFWRRSEESQVLTCSFVEGAEVTIPTANFSKVTELLLSKKASLLTLQNTCPRGRVGRPKKK